MGASQNRNWPGGVQRRNFSSNFVLNKQVFFFHLHNLHPSRSCHYLTQVLVSQPPNWFTHIQLCLYPTCLFLSSQNIICKIPLCSFQRSLFSALALCAFLLGPGPPSRTHLSLYLLSLKTQSHGYPSLSTGFLLLLISLPETFFSQLYCLNWSCLADLSIHRET